MFIQKSGSDKLIFKRHIKVGISLAICMFFINFKSIASPEFSIPKSEYLKQFGSEFVKEFCSDDQFLKCFRISKTNCIETSKIEFNSCVKVLKFPAQFEYVDFASKYEKDLGECVGSNMAHKFRLDFKNSVVCQTKVVN